MPRFRTTCHFRELNVPNPRPSPALASDEPFLVLPENRFAYTAATSAGNETAATPQPLYLYGPSGVGKSHLARHCARLVLRRRRDARYQQLFASQFAAELAEASSTRKVPDFQLGYRKLDLFVLEDLHAIEGRMETQRQLLSFLDELTAGGCQIVWTCRKSPGELANFLPKLVNRFHAGVTALVRLPGLESRISLISHFAKGKQIPLPGTAVRILAEALPVSPRELLAAVQQLETSSRMKKSPLDAAYVQRFLANEVRPQGVELADIARAVSQHFDLALSALRSRGRVQGLVLPRQCAMFLSRELTGKGLEQIGKYYGNRDHSTVVHSCNRFRSLMSDDPAIRLHLNQIRNSLGVNAPVPMPDDSPE